MSDILAEFELQIKELEDEANQYGIDEDSCECRNVSCNAERFSVQKDQGYYVMFVCMLCYVYVYVYVIMLYYGL